MTVSSQPILVHRDPVALLSPAVAAALALAQSPAQAEFVTRQLAHEHYENFSVVSMLLPKHRRQDFCNVYAFCRVADDLGDEVGDTTLALELLGKFKEQTIAAHAHSGEMNPASNAVLTALTGTIRRHDIPVQPFVDLIDAF